MWEFTRTPPLHTIIYNMDYPFRGALFVELLFLVTENVLSWGYVILTYDKLSDKKLRLKLEFTVVLLYLHPFLVPLLSNIHFPY